MLRVCTALEYTALVDDMYSLALDKSKSGYPSYCDGIKTKEMFLERSKRAFSEKNEELLLFEYNGTVEGWIHFYWLPEDRYLSTVSFLARSHTAQALKEFLEMAREEFGGYELWLGFSEENTEAVSFLAASGFELIEKSNDNTAFLREYAALPTGEDVLRITKENFELFRLLHSPVEEDMYWNSDRIFAALDRWNVFVRLRNGEPMGSVYFLNADTDWYEIFGVDMKDNSFDAETFRILLTAALNAAKEMGGKYMTFFCEDEAQASVEEAGFKCMDCYNCYKKLLD